MAKVTVAKLLALHPGKPSAEKASFGAFAFYAISSGPASLRGITNLKRAST
ncbi:MAG: hypothetical protein IJN40_00195 [Clostridia bacterium]|nr:hypothetical protein [Clostridia bacterium]